MKKLMSIEIRGQSKSWCFSFYSDPKHLADWNADGLRVVVIENTIPFLVAQLGLTRPWCFMQDIFNLRNPWRR